MGVVGLGEPLSYGVGGVGRGAVGAFADPGGVDGVEWDVVEVSEGVAEGGGLVCGEWCVAQWLAR